MGPGFHSIGQTTCPNSSLPHSASRSHPSPTSTEFFKPGHRDRNAQSVKHVNKANKVNPDNKSEIRRRATTFTPHSLWSPLTGVSSRPCRRVFQSANTTRVVARATTTFQHHGGRHFSLGSPKRVENKRRSSGKISDSLWKPASKHSTRPLPVRKCK